MNSSATGGYLNPSSSSAPPGGLTLDQFLQTMVVGISGYPTTLVRPRWQLEAPLQPRVNVDWVSFGIHQNTPDANAAVDLDFDGDYFLNRQKTLELLVSFYGPHSGDNISAFTDGFQIQQNLAALRSANMGFKESSASIRVPELVNELWMDRWDMTLILVIQELRTYNVLSFASAVVTINTVFENPYSKTINVEDT